MRTTKFNGFSETHRHATRSWHILPLRQNVVRPFYVCRNDRNVQFDGKQDRTTLKSLHFAIRRPSALRIKDEVAASLLHELPASCQAGRQRLRSWFTIDRYDIHEGRDCPAQAARTEEIVAGADQRKVAKAAPAGGHQHRTVGMTAVIAAKQEWRVRKMMPLFYCERTIPLEECSAKAFEAETACRGCLERVTEAGPATHSVKISNNLQSLNLWQELLRRMNSKPADSKKTVG